MAEQSNMEASAVETESVGKTLTRRGILAVAGAAVATLIAKQAAEPVAAISTMEYANTTTPVTNFALGQTTLSAQSGFSGFAVLSVDASFLPGTSDGIVAYSGNGNGVEATTYALPGNGSAGVLGYGNGSNTYGVLGDGNGGIGVQGKNAQTGVVGLVTNANNTVAVYGHNQSSGSGGVGVVGLCDVASGTGVRGTSVSGFPIFGSVGGAGSLNAGVLGTGTARPGGAGSSNAGVLGTGTAGPGGQGQSTGGHGLVGYSSATDGHAGLVGYALTTGGIGLMGIGPNYPAVGNKAGVFYGDVEVHGALRVYGMPKNAAVKHEGDNTYRLLYCEESPESWFGDYGKAKLVNGQAVVRLDPDFAALVHTDDYHVFLTAYGNTNGLHVTNQGATGFTVEEHNGGKNSLTISYRVVARRKDIVGERLAKVAPPIAPNVPTVFTIPETPVVTPPARKP